ncbi:MAG: cation:proton antiporter [Candidatus Micrarchaeota archaeon]
MDAFADFGIILVVATLAGAIAIKLRQPSVIGLLVAGMIIGPHQFGLVGETDFIRVLAEVGSVLLLFAIGLEFNIEKLREYGAKAVLIATTKIGLIILIGYIAGRAVGLTSITSLFLGAILSITSTAIFVKIIEESDLANRKEVPLLISVLIVEDILAVFLLAIFSGIGSGQGGLSFSLISSVANSFLLFGIFYLIVSRVIKAALEWLAENQANETLAFASLSVGLGLSYVAQMLGIPAAVGAFLAGNLIASVRQSDSFKQAVYPLIFAFSALFFLSIGLGVNLGAITSNLLLVFVITVVAIAVKFIASNVSHYFVEGDSKSAVFTGLALLSIGEFSLLLAGASHGVVKEIDLVSITSVLVFVTSIATTLSISKNELIWRKTRNLVPSQIVEIGKSIAMQNRQIFDFFQFNYNFQDFVKRSFSFLSDNFLVLLIGVGVIGATFYSGGALEVNGATITYSAIGICVALIAVALITARTVNKLRENLKYVDLKLVLNNISKLVTTSALIWLIVAITAALAVFHSNINLIDAFIVIGLIVIVGHFFTSGKPEQGALLFGKKY